MNVNFEKDDTITLRGVSHDDLCDILNAFEELRRPDKNQKVLLAVFTDIYKTSKHLTKGVLHVNKENN